MAKQVLATRGGKSSSVDLTATQARSCIPQASDDSAFETLSDRTLWRAKVGSRLDSDVIRVYKSCWRLFVLVLYVMRA